MADLELRLEGDLKAVRSTLGWMGSEVAAGEVDLRLSARNLEDLRWLQEDPIVDLYGPGEGRRARAEEAAQRIGGILFRAVSASDPMRQLLDQALAPGQPTGLVISSQNPRLLLLPWELMRSPSSGWLNDRLEGLARGHGDLDTRPVAVQEQGKRLRILLVTARPKAEEDVEYRIVASRLLDQVEKCADVTVVRPGTFEALERYIQQGRYELIHYDGHGAEGLLWFEDQMVEASRLGQILARSGVPLFVLNACRSAVNREESQAEPGQINSVAHGLLSTGAWGVLAMSANVRVTSTVAYFDRFYAELASGASLTRAAHRARRSLETALHVGPMDWAIPVLYLRSDFTPFQPDAAPSQEVLQILKGESSTLEPAGPSDIFIGRDGDLFKVDRALDEHSRVLVYGVGGIGKTTLMQHMLRWRRRTGGADRVFSFSFRAAPTLEALAIQLQEAVIEVHPEIRNYVQSPEWADLPTQDKLTHMGKVIAADEQIHWLLLFDNLETLGGYPLVGDGSYTDEGRQAFQSLLGVLENRSCRVVLTARRDEEAWLEGHTRRFPLTGVKPWYRLEMLRSYAESFRAEARLKQGSDQLGDLLRELGGHPLATRVAAYGLKDRSVGEVLASIRGQMSQIEVPTAEEGMRSLSLEAVIGNAIKNFSLEHRRVLGLLSLFGRRLHFCRFLEIIEAKGFPEELLPDNPSELIEIFREGAQLGIMAPDPSFSGMLEMVPGAQVALEPLWREGMSPEQIQAVKRHFLLCWAEVAIRSVSAFHSQGLARDAVKTFIYEEENLRRALDIAAELESWKAAAALLSLVLGLLPILGRTMDADHLRTRWLDKVSRNYQPRDPSNQSQVKLWQFLSKNLAERAIQVGDWEQAKCIYGQIAQTQEAISNLTKADRIDLAASYQELGVIEIELGRFDQDEKWCRKSLRINNELGYYLGMANNCHELGLVEQVRGRLDKAKFWCQNSLLLNEHLGNRPGQAQNCYLLGVIEQLQGRFRAAEQLYQESLEIDKELGDRPAQAKDYHQLGRVEEERRRFDEAEKWYRKSLQIKSELGNSPGQSRSYFQLGRVEEERGRLTEAEKWYQRSLQIDEELGDRLGQSRGYHQLGIVKEKRRQFDEAEKWHQKSLQIEERLDNRLGQAQSYHQLGNVRLMRGHLNEAEECYRKSLQITEELGNQSGQANAYQQLGLIEEQRGRLDEAEKWYRKSLQIREERGERSKHTSLNHLQLAIIEQERGRLDRAERWFRKSLEVEEELGDFEGQAQCSHHLGEVKGLQGRLDEAENWFRRSLDIEEELGDRLGQALSYHQLGAVEYLRGRLDAEKSYQESLQITEELSERAGQARTYYQLAIIELVRGHLDKAEKWCRESVQIREEQGDRSELASSYHQLGGIEWLRGRLTEAMKWSRKCLHIVKELDNRSWLARCCHQLGRIAEEMGLTSEALEVFMISMRICSEIEDLDWGSITIRSIRRLDRTLGRETFLDLWEQRTGSRKPPKGLLEDDEETATEEKPSSPDFEA